MKVCLDFRNVVSMGVAQLVDLIQLEDKEFFSFLDKNKVTVNLGSGADKYPSFTFESEHGMSKAIEFLTELRKVYPILTYEVYLFKQKLAIRCFVVDRFGTSEDVQTVVICEAKRDISPKGACFLINSDNIKKIFNLKKEFNASYILNQEARVRNFTRDGIRLYLESSTVRNTDSWMGRFDAPINSFNVYVDFHDKTYPSSGNTMEIMFNHSDKEQTINLVMKYHNKDLVPKVTFDDTFTFEQFAWWLNGKMYGVLHDNFCTGFLINRLYDYLSPKTLFD